jgi:hypothetical protein
MKYKIEEILVGDEVYFESTKLQSNHDEYWTVTGKTDNEIYIEFKKFGFDETWTLNIDEVLYRNHTSKLRSKDQ